MVELNGIELGASRNRPSACRSDRSPLERKSYNIPLALSSSLPPTDLKYFSLEAALDRVLYSSL